MAPRVEEALIYSYWFCIVTGRGVPVSVPVVRQRSLLNSWLVTRTAKQHTVGCLNGYLGNIKQRTRREEQCCALGTLEIHKTAQLALGHVTSTMLMEQACFNQPCRPVPELHRRNTVWFKYGNGSRRYVILFKRVTK
jgi:hypothetical protein